MKFIIIELFRSVLIGSLSFIVWPFLGLISRGQRPILRPQLSGSEVDCYSHETPMVIENA
ncbi:hypothetical protein SAMN04488556_0749 [Halostagnicola kamekurae]|uniref:Uncharacterized protein n=1 Tax=Halostagnicola kamekurae TaxID=619731 RepID=A0A1I6PSC3_9EURY|nr:hypothetical protein SAMN04488556_0749 [Halostagnicola kamekurae]